MAEVFQSLIGRLETASNGTNAVGEPVFQSLIGRLETLQRKLAARKAERFQSLIGRLETRTCRNLAEIGLCSFNPS